MIARIKLDGKLKEAYETLSSLAMIAYRDIYLLSNQVLSKNPFSNNYLKNYLAEKSLTAVSVHEVAYKLAKYYLSSMIHYKRFISRFAVHRKNGPRFDVHSDQSELIVLDTFFLCDKIVEAGRFSELYFKELDGSLEKMKKNYVYLPVFYGCNDLSIFRKVFNILKRDRVPVLCEYQLLSIKDLLLLFIFILAYPWHVLNFVRKMEVNDRGKDLARNEMLVTLDQVTFFSYSRYLQGKRIARLPYKKIKVISWYENQVIDKNLYKGLRTNRDKVAIYGAQLYVYSKMDLNYIVDEKESVFNVIPDKIIVNGPFFIPESNRLKYATGASLRYKELFRTSVQKERQKDILVLLSHSLEDTRNILRMLSESNLSSQSLVIKLHPAAFIDEFRDFLLTNWTVVNKDIYDLFETAKVVIGSASGGLVEAISLGIPTIRIINSQGLDYNILPELGKGIIWGEAGTAQELTARVSEFETITDQNYAMMAEIAEKYKQLFFCEPTHEKIIETFGL